MSARSARRFGRPRSRRPWPPWSSSGAPCSSARRLGTEFLPQLDEGVIWIRANLPAGISLEKSAAVAGRIRELIRQSPEVKLVMSQTGRNESGTDPFGPNRNEFLLDLQPYRTWPRGKQKADLVEELSRRLEAEIPGASFNFTQPIIDTSTEIATGSSADLAVIISGPDLARLRAAGDRDARASCRSVPGAADTSIEQEADQAQLQIDIDRHQVARYGINVADVQDVIDLAIGGTPIAAVFEGERRFDVVGALRSRGPRRRRPRSASSSFPPATAARVPLAQLADIQVVDGATIIARRENRRQISVRTNIRGRDQGGFVAEAQARFADAVKLPPGYDVSWGGQFENFERARQRLGVILPITDRHHLRAALLDLRLRARRAARAAERAVLARRRRGGALPARHPPQRLGGGRLRLAVRRGGDERRALRRGGAPPARRRRRPSCARRRWRPRACSSDRCCC